MAKTVLSWHEVDTASFSRSLKASLKTLKEKQAELRTVREAFEAAFLTEYEATQGKLPTTERMVFGYRFGKISIAIDEAKAAPKAGKLFRF